MMNSGVTVKSFSRHCLGSWVCGWVSRRGKETAFSFRQSGFLSLKEYWQLGIIWDIPRYPVRLGEDHESPIGLVSASPMCISQLPTGHFKWHQASVLQQNCQAHLVLLLPTSYHLMVEWLCRHRKAHREKLSDLTENYKWKWMIPLGSLPLHHLVLELAYEKLFSIGEKSCHLSAH